MSSQPHEPGDSCRSQQAFSRIEQLIDRWWSSPPESGQRVELQEAMHFISACPQCRATMAERVIENGLRTIEHRLQKSEDDMPAKAYARVMGRRRRPGKPS
ncbi:MAG: hypothetical protein EOP64_00120 [Sphingomonas sp.]|nr:MAG: hypothetical protein EOP64_00120 [Sphingomonas sp.]